MHALRLGDILRLTNGTRGRVVSITSADCVVSTSTGLTSLYGDSLRNAYRLSRGPVPRRDDRARRGRRAAPVTPIGAAPAAGPRTRADPRSSIYIVNLGYGAFKVGYTRSVKRRMRQLRVASLQPLELCREWKVPRADAARLETMLKRLFAEVFTPTDGGGTEVFHGNDARAVRLAQSHLAPEPGVQVVV